MAQTKSMATLHAKQLKKRHPNNTYTLVNAEDIKDFKVYR
jgi:hypothetical protein